MYGLTALHLAAFNDHARTPCKCFDILITGGARLDVVKLLPSGATPLMLAQQEHPAIRRCRMCWRNTIYYLKMMRWAQGGGACSYCGFCL